MNKKVQGMILSAVLLLPLQAMAQDAPLVPSEPPLGAPADETVPGTGGDAVKNTEGAAAETPLDTIPVQAPADAAAGPETGERPASRLVGEIVVTAQKREENIQEVPIAITAFSPEVLDAIGIETVQDLERATPGLTITNAAAYNVAYLRGIGTDAFLAGADPSVPFYLDGVALLGTQGSSDTLGRVKRVEVLKGPQGTLFGRNATGGAISIITPDPDDEVAGDLKLEYADYDELSSVGYINVPLHERVAFSVSAFYNTHDNYYKNDYVDPQTGEKGPIIDIYARGFRTKGRWLATDNFSLTATYSYFESSNNAGLSFENTRVAPVFSLLLPEDPKRDRHIRYDQAAGAEINSRLTSVIAAWELPWVDLKLIASDQQLDAPFVQSDFDKSPLPLVSFTSIKQIAKQKTAELQFLSNDGTPGSERFEWVGGIYYIESDGGFDPLQFTVAPNFLNTLPIPGGGTLASLIDGLAANLNLPLPASGAGIRLNSHGVSVAESISVYFQGTFKIVESLDLTAGVRYQEEDRDLRNGKVDVVNADGSTTNFRTDSVPTLKAEQISPKVALQWRPFDELSQIYLSWARAFKSPTYNTVNFFNTPEAVDEEQVDSYELGFKSDLFDANLRLNGAVFYIEQKDLLSGFVALASGGVVTYANAGDAEIKGAEAEFVWTPFPDWNAGLALTGAITYLDTEYTEYRDGRGFDLATGLAFGEGSLTALPARDFTGNEVVRSPKLTYSFGINQRIPLGAGAIEIGADTYYNDGFFFLPQGDDIYRRQDYQLVNARVSYFYDPWGVQFTIFGENVTDEEYNEVIFSDDFGRNEVLNSPRVVGARINWSF